MPVIYIPKELYDKLVRLGEEPQAFVPQAAEEKLEQAKPAPKAG